MILKNLIRFKAHYFFALIFISIGVYSCDEDTREVMLFEKGTAEATASSNIIQYGESVNFASTATKVQTLNWTFAGGSPASSSDENVTVTYAVPGTYEAKLLVKYIDNTSEYKTFTIIVEGPDEPLPFGGTPVALPGTVEAENYDLGGEGTAYHDTEEENKAETAGSATYRADDGVDVQVSADGSLINIGYTNTDEWMNYTVNVAEAGGFDFDFVVASGATDGGKSIKIQLFNQTTGAITDLGETGDFANTGGWETYVSVPLAGINLAAGLNTLRVLFTGGSTNLDKINVTAASTGGGGAPLGPLNIAFVTDDITTDAGYITLLEDAGHTVEAEIGKYNNLDAAGAAILNGFDLIIISRNTNSGNFGDAARPSWMTVTKPVLNLSSFVARNTRLQYFNSADQLEGAGTSIKAIDISHPVFTNVPLNGDMVDVTTASLHVIGTNNAGNGTLIGTTGDGISATIAIFEANTAAYSGGSVFAGKRMFLSGTGNGFTYNEAGSQLFLNCVEYIVTGNVGGGGNSPGETLGLFTERTVTNTVDLTFQVNNNFVISDTGSASEGSAAKAFETDPAAADKSWAMATIKPTTAPLDISAFANGFYNIAMKSDSNGTILFRIQQGSTRAIITFNAVDNLYGFVRDGQWHNLKIPMADIIALQPNIDLTQISDILVLRSEGDVSAANNYNFYIDDFYLSMD